MQGHAPFEGQRRIHLGLSVRDLEASRTFYEVLLGVPPIKVREGYAKFEPTDPPVNLSLYHAAAGVPKTEDHFGIQVRSTEAVQLAVERLAAAGLTTELEEATACCYAVQDKAWATDPDGRKWEVFVVLDPDVDILNEEDRKVPNTCCPDRPAAPA